MESRTRAADGPVQERGHAVTSEEAIADLNVHLRHDHVLDLDDRDLLERATTERQQRDHRPDPTPDSH